MIAKSKTSLFFCFFNKTVYSYNLFILLQLIKEDVANSILLVAAVKIFVDFHCSVLNHLLYPILNAARETHYDGHYSLVNGGYGLAGSIRGMIGVTLMPVWYRVSYLVFYDRHCAYDLLPSLIMRNYPITR